MAPKTKLSDQPMSSAADGSFYMKLVKVMHEFGLPIHRADEVFEDYLQEAEKNERKSIQHGGNPERG